jgi:L-lactate dehydrogenase complex protein LldG
LSAREEILGRVRDALGAPPDGVPAAIPREYRTHAEPDANTFITRLAHYQAKTHVVTARNLNATVRRALAERGARRVVAPDGVPQAWLTGIEPLRDSPPLSPEELDGCDGLLSTCALAIAETGTIVLDTGPGMGRRILSLVPDYHLCIVHSHQIVGSVPEALARLDPLRPLTFISGPSATVDIELVRVGGVHGPRTLEVVLVTPPTGR